MYSFETDLVKALLKYDEINSKLQLLEDQKELIRKQVIEWRELNKIRDSEKVIIKDPNSVKSWTIDRYKQNRKSIKSYPVLIEKLGEDAKSYITESESYVLKITSR